MSLWTSLCIYSFTDRSFLSPGHKIPEKQVHILDLSRHCTRQVPNSCLCTGWVPEKGRGAGLPSLSKRRANSPPPSTAQLPGYCPRPGRHLLWVISICMAIITAFGKKIPLSKKPCRVANAGTELEAATPPSSRLLPIMQELPVPPPLPWPQKSTAAPAGSFGQPGPPQPASCLREGALRKGWPCLCMLQGSQRIQSTR